MNGENKMSDWTPEQKYAINAEGTGIIVSAAAGSGKTSVLVERLIRILSDTENKVSADRLVVVTFTNDAAAQMKQRLSDALSKKLADEPENTWLCQQQALLQTAKISTIHSFCFDLIRENIQSVDVSAGFRILDDSEETMLMQNAAAETFEKFYADQPEEMEKLCDFFSGSVKGDAELEEAVLNVYKFLVSIPFYEDWAEEAIACYSAKEITENDRLAAFYTARLEKIYTKIIDQAKYIDGVFSAEFKKSSKAIADDITNISALLNKLKNNSEWDKKIEPPSFKFITFDSPRKLSDEQTVVKNRIKGIRDGYKKELGKISDEIFTSDEIKADYTKHMEILKGLFSLVECFGNELRKLKNEKNALGFSDAEQLAVRLLAEKDGEGKIVKTKLAKDLSDYYAMIMIDEFQDANNNQDLIFKMLSKNGTSEKGGTNLFTVGDVKQSIYRFRLANPNLFLDALKKSAPYTGPDFSGTNASIQLNMNFRSSEPVIGFVNYVFGKLMSSEVGDVDYTSSEALVKGAVYPAGERDTEIIIVPDDTDNNVSGNGGTDGPGEKKSEEQADNKDKDPASGEADTETEIRSALEKRNVFSKDESVINESQDDPDESEDDAYSGGEARAAALKIRSMLGSRTVWDKGEERPCEPRDFCILLRSKKNAEAYVKELAAAGIKAHAEEPDGYLRSREISVLISMLAVIDNPMQNIHLAAVLMSPMFMLDAEDMAKLAEIKKDDEKYFSAVKSVLAGETEIEPDSLLYRKLDRFMKMFEKLRYCAASQRLERLIRTIYDSTDFLSAVQIYEDGNQKKANLRLLLDVAEGYENNSGGGISGFVRYTDMLISRDGDLKRASVVSPNENAVSVKTIHKSKGLEYPFVFLCGTSSQFNISDLNSRTQINSDFGIGMKIQDRENLKLYNSFPRFVISEINRANSVSEEMRLLYVALTRAREQIFITVPGNSKVRKRIESISTGIVMSGGITSETAAGARSMLDWITAAMLVHPDGEWFRGEEKDLPIENTDVKVKVSFSSGEKLTCEKTEKTDIKADESTVRMLNEAFDFSYPDELTKQSAKITVTEIAKSETGDKLYLRRPEFVSQKGELTAAEKGTAMHTFMQYANYPAAELDPAAEAERLAENGLLSPEERDSLNIGQLAEFFGSELYMRMKNSDNIRREQKFLVKKSDAGLDDERLMEYNNDSMLQGIADCMFEENGGIVLIDYKTDRVSDPQTLIDRYDLQIKLYAAALSRIFGKKVKEAYLYSFSLGRAVKAL